MKGRLALALALTIGLVTASLPSGGSVAADRERWDTRVLAHVQSPGFPAFVYAHPNGRVYVGTYTNPAGDSQRSKVLEYRADGTLLRSWTVPGQDLGADHGIQVATSDSRGRLLLLEKSTSRAVLLNIGSGRFRSYATFPDLPACSAGSRPEPCTPNLVDDPAVPNYAAWGRHGELYVSDYGQAVIWRVPPGGGRARPWFTDRRLDGIEFGTAGLVLAPGHRALLITQQSSAGLGEPTVTQGKLYRLRITHGGKPGVMRTLWESRAGDLPDGFGIARSGHIYIASAGLSQQLVELDSDGTEIERFPATPFTGENGSDIPFDTPSSATFLGRRILVANQAFFGDTSHHAVLDVYVGERGVPTFVPRGAGVR